ncbi:MAG: 4-oxalocrotonate tautomerase family protein [Desulfobacterota bacterium]|nr:4-oxalocrotonate tautomerase family protein [Thermodesulfobacteriota bacterium]
MAAEKIHGGECINRNPRPPPPKWRKESTMPLIQISLIQGRTSEKKELLIKKVTEATAEALEISRDKVHIVLYEIPKENIAHGGVPLTKADF